MRRTELSTSALPAWAKLNDVLFYDIRVEKIDDRGFGLVAERAMSSDGAFDVPALLRLPKELVLSAESIEEHARVDKHFRELLDAAGSVSTRGDILLFLLMQMTITCPDVSRKTGVSNPWTEYVKLLPSDVPVPTTWTEEHRMLLIGTSLESALSAKMSALEKEFNRLQELTTTIAWCEDVWWARGGLTINDWVRLDSWYRSRCLELPGSGESMVPCLDMVNHTNDANAYYEQGSSGEVVLLLKPNSKVKAGEEITISYGSSKSAAEMLFSYGFVGEDIQMQSLVLGIQPLPDDPLSKAKIAAFPGAPQVLISSKEKTVEWSSPFAFLMCLNEEDGLEFRVLQEVDGSQGQLQVFWLDKDVTDTTDKFAEYVNEVPNRDVFRLRVVNVLQTRIRQQLEQVYDSADTFTALESFMVGSGGIALTSASQLRAFETALLEDAYDLLDSQTISLIASPAVQRYLASASIASANQAPGDDERTNEEDFS